MKMKCRSCGEKIRTDSKFCFYCGTSTKKQRERRSLTTRIVVLTTIGVLVFLMFIIPLFNARIKIINYVHKAHPDSKIVEEHIKYDAKGFGFIFEIYPDCYIKFEENGFQYVVYYGERRNTIIDHYKEMKLTNDVRVFINEEFFKPRGIENVDISIRFGFNNSSELPNEWSEYDDSYTVNLAIRDQGSTPREVGWIYDFYKFWKENMIFSPEWYLYFIISNADDVGFLGASYKSSINNEADMYKFFH